MDATSTGARKLEALRQALGPAILAALEDPQVVEILANPDGRLVLDRLGSGRQDTALRLSAEARDRVIRLVADHVGEAVTPDAPRLSGVLPGGERFQGVTPPVASGPAFAIRKRAGRIWSLDDYVRQAVLTADQAAILRSAVGERRNLLICGGAGSGKTTLANALLAEPAFAGDRVILIEDTVELQSVAWDLLPMLTQGRSGIGISDLVRDAMRLRPDRIVIGEIRDGAAALETLKAWNTGHPGGLSTLHANSAADAILRLEDLLLETMPTVPARLIGQAIQLIVFLRRTPCGRRVEEIARLAPGADGAPTLERIA